MRNKNHFKKFITYVVVAVYILSLIPASFVSIAAEDTTTSVIYDAYISGNFVTGETLTANYSFDNPNLDTTNTNATIKWYAESRFGSNNSSQPLRVLTLGSDKTKYTIIKSETIPNSNAYSIYFEVTPKDASNNTIGKTVYSAIGTNAANSDGTSTAAPTIRNAMIVPQNVSGTTLVGDTLAARFSYRCVNGSDLKSAAYQWYYGDTMSTKTIIEGATSSTYTIQPKDMGKWIFVEITPTAENGSVGSAVIAKTHLGNVFRLDGVSFDTSKSSGITNFKYNRVQIIADGTTNASGGNSGNGFLSTSYSAGLKTVVIDAGKQVPFNGMYFNFGVTDVNNTPVDYWELSYSSDGTAWTSVKKVTNPSDKRTGNGYNADEIEFTYTDKVRYARYFKADINKPTTTSSTRFLAFHDFYPFVTNKARPKVELKGDKEVSLLASPGAAAYADAGYIFSNTPEGYTEDYIKSNLITSKIANSAGATVADIDTTTPGEYKVSYTLSMPGLEEQTVSREIVIGNGKKTPGNLAYYYEDDKNLVTYTNMTNVNSLGGAPAINDGNPNTTSVSVLSDGVPTLPASAVIEVNDTEVEDTYVSKFTIDENGNNITGFNIYVSEDGNNWGTPVHTGVSLGDSFSLTLPEPQRADFIKLEITSASDAFEIKDVEVFLDDDSKLKIAKDKILSDFETEIRKLKHRNGYIYKNIPIATSGIYGTKATWNILSGFEAAVADAVNGELKITRQNTTTPLTIDLWVEFKEDKPGLAIETINKTVAKKSVPKAIDVHIKGNFVIGQTLTIPDTYYYDEAGVPEDKSSTKLSWYRRNKWNRASTSLGDLSAKIPCTSDTYTIDVKDLYDSNELLYNIYVSVIPASMADDDAKMGTESFSPIYASPSTVSVGDEPSISSQYISSQSLEGTMLAGDTLSVHYAYINRGGIDEGSTSYRWQTRTSLDSIPEFVTSDSPSNKTYTLTEADFGKWIECIITPVSKNGTRGKSVTARNHYGNAILADEATGKGLRDEIAIPFAKIIAYSENGDTLGSDSSEDKGLYSDATDGSTKGDYTNITLDAGFVRPFNAFYVDIGAATFNEMEFFYKVNEADEYIKAKITSSDNITANSSVLIELSDGGKLARYFKLKTRTGSGYTDLNAFYPCITQNATASIEFPEDLRVLKGDMSFNASTAFIWAKNAVGSDASPTVSGTVDVNTQGSYPVSYTIETTGTAWFPVYTVTKTFTVVDGIAQGGDEAYGADVSTSCGSDGAALTDGNPNTSWTGEGTSADIILNLNFSTPVSKAKFDETGTNINTVSVYTSKDGSSWTLVPGAENLVLSDGNIDFKPQETKYIKFSLSYVTAPTVSALEVSASAAAKAEIAASKLSVPSNASSDIVLPTSGAYGTTIEWTSSNSSVISKYGAVTKGASAATVTLTANFKEGLSTIYSKSFTVTVPANTNVNPGMQNPGANTGSISGSSGFSVSGPAPAPVAPVNPAEPSYKTFADVPNNHWAAVFVNSLAKEGIVSGRSANSFEPDAQITRAEFLKLIVESLGLTAENASADFEDVSENDWFYKYVSVGFSLGIAKGADGYFNPNEPILRRDMAVMAQRAVDAAGLELKKISDVKLTDIDFVTEYAKEAVELLSSAGIINGNQNAEFMPDNNATRAETAKIIYMLIEQTK